MIKVKTGLLLTISIFLFVGLSCDDKSEDEFIEVNEWILSEMQQNYLWNENIPSIADGKVMPNPYFGSLLEAQDNISYITTESIQSDVAFSSGISPSFFGFSNSNRVFAVVEFVYPGSPADTAGIQRGDIILSVDDANLNNLNYESLFYKNSPTVTYSLGIFDSEQNTIIEVNERIEVAQGNFDLNPLISSKILENQDSVTKTGFLMLGELREGQNNKFIDSLDVAFQSFKNEGVSELIVDLRYCRGGTFSVAENIANSIVPQINTENKDVFVRFRYNTLVEQSIIDSEGDESDSLQIRFSENPENLNLQRVYFLTTNRTSSTAEMLIKGLEPYMEVNIVGDVTAGIQYGSRVISGINANQPNEYTLVPVTQLALSSEEETEFSEQILPDIFLDDDLFRNVFQPGDENDTFISAALGSINGENFISKPNYYIPFSSLKSRKTEKSGLIWFE